VVDAVRRGGKSHRGLSPAAHLGNNRAPEDLRQTVHVTGQFPALRCGIDRIGLRER